MPKTFYISDTHFFHENIITFDNRPFETVTEMNEKIKENWNNTVSKEDMVYILGDFSWKFHDEAIAFLKSLNGRKRLIKGNHDKSHNSNFKNLFESITLYDKVEDEGRTVVLSHYPIVAYDGSFKGRAIHLFGHVHVTTTEAKMVADYIKRNKSEDFPMKMYNVGVMVSYINYCPQTLDYILENGENNEA